MTPRQRFLTAFNGGIPDRVPICEHLFSRKLLQEQLGYTTVLYEGEAQTKLATKLGIDAPIKSREDWEKYKLPEVNTPNRLKILQDTINANEEDLAVVVGLLGPFTMMTWYFMDFQAFSMALFMDPELVHEMVDAFVDWNLEAAKLASDSGGVDVFQISDDWGGSNGLLISPEHFGEFFMKPFKKLVQGLKALGAPVIMHNDGHIWDVLDDLVATGISGFHPVEKTVMKWRG